MEEEYVKNLQLVGLN